MNKYQHVRQAKQTRTHHCHWPGCEENVPPAMWGCRKHWYTLPKDIRDEIWNAYTAGQEETRSPSRRYVEAANRAQVWIRDHLAGRHDTPRANDKRTLDLFGDSTA